MVVLGLGSVLPYPSVGEQLEGELLFALRLLATAVLQNQTRVGKPQSTRHCRSRPFNFIIKNWGFGAKPRAKIMHTFLTKIDFLLDLLTILVRGELVAP